MTSSKPCCSDRLFDRMLSGDLGAARVDQLRVHLNESPACKRRYDEICAAREEFLGGSDVRPRLPAIARPNPTRVRGWGAGIAVGLVACAAVAWRVAVGGIAERGAEPVHRSGSGALSILVRSAAITRVVLPGETVLVGDLISVQIRTPEPTFVAVLGIDGGGSVTAYYPAELYTERVAATEGRRLGGSVELGATPGDETVLGFFCSEPRAIEVLLDATRAAGSRLPAVNSCGVDRVVLHKSERR